MQQIINWFSVKDLNEINRMILLDSSEKEDYGLEDFISSEQIISITSDITDNKSYLVVYKRQR